MRSELIVLREIMKKQEIDAYLIPTTDFHGSEYVNEYFMCREYVSGFTGSAGTLLVTHNDAKLWTDGRYFLQAERQLKGTGIDLMKMGEPGVPTILEYIKESMNEEMVLGFDGRVVDWSTGSELEKHCKVLHNVDLVGDIWKDRPELKASKIYSLKDEVTGESSQSKLKRVRDMMKEKGAEHHFISRLEDIAWLYNLRGDDVKHTPVFFAFALISQDEDRLYIMDESFKGENIYPYMQIYQDLGNVPGGHVLLDKNVVSYSAVKAFSENIEFISGNNPCELMKCIKNKTEIQCTKNAHVKDGVAMVNFIYWLKSNVGKIQMSEIGVSDYLYGYRAAQEGFNDLSFTTIAGFGPNGAIVHYEATKETNADIYPEGFLLVDSGGQYDDGTTDITRTIAMGPLTDEMKKHYTAVLKAHIKLARTRFIKGTCGQTLDVITRKPLMDMGLNYNHGTGHGIGHLLGVHEGPMNINPRNVNFAIEPGMIMSDEPGVYLEGKYGIRLENEILFKEGEDGLVEAEPITYCPFDMEAVDLSMLDMGEKQWLKEYGKMVYEKLAQHLSDEVSQWLKLQTEV